jgi:class 3 adenylate cyclase
MSYPRDVALRETLRPFFRHPIARGLAGVLTANGLVGIVLAAAFHSVEMRDTTVALLLVLVTLLLSTKLGRVACMTAALTASVGFGVWFEDPVGHIQITDPESWIAVIMFLITSFLVAHLSLQARMRASEALHRQRETEMLYGLGKALVGVESVQAVAWTVVNQLVPHFGARGAAFHFLATDEIVEAGNGPAKLSRDVLRAVSAGQQPPAEGQVALVPVARRGETIGSLAISGGDLSQTMRDSLANLLSVACDRVRAVEALVEANRESEALLLNILPGEVARELRSNGMVAPRYFEDVTIIFIDIVSFTISTEKLAAEDLVVLLNDYFTAFDRISVRYGLEKLKTIGDCYMCLSGLPTRNPANPVDAVLAAFEMLQEVVARDRPENLVRWQVRIGMHTGPVVAGVVGINKFAFDIWGDAVNFSSRMESSSQPNRINVSALTYSRVKDFFACDARGKVLTKEGRAVDMYFVNGVLPRLADGDGSPPHGFLRRYRNYFQKDPPAFPAFLVASRGPAAAAAE